MPCCRYSIYFASLIEFLGDVIYLLNFLSWRLFNYSIKILSICSLTRLLLIVLVRLFISTCYSLCDLAESTNSLVSFGFFKFKKCISFCFVKYITYLLLLAFFSSHQNIPSFHTKTSLLVYFMACFFSLSLRDAYFFYLCVYIPK